MLKNIISKLSVGRLLVLLSVCCYLGNHYYSIYFRSYQHLGPMGLDDSDFYVSRIAYFKYHWLPGKFPESSGNYRIPVVFTEFHGIVSAFLLGKCAVLLNISSEKMFLWNFYIGITLMGIVLFLLMRNLDKGYAYLITAFLIFSFYSGSGSSHGFFWVAPSFYCLMLWLLSVTVFFFSAHWFFYGFIVLFLLFFSHPIGPYAIITIIATLIFHSILKQTNGLKNNFNKKDLLSNIISSKSVYILTLLIACYSLYALLRTTGILPPLLAERRLAFQHRLFLPFSSLDGFRQLWTQTGFKTYFSLFLPMTAFSLYHCWKKQQYLFVSLFISVLTGNLLFCIFSSNGGQRTFLFLEVLLLLILSYGVKESILYLWNNRNNNILRWRLLTFREKPIYIINWFILISACGLLLFLSYTRIASDFCMRFRGQRYWNSEELKKILSDKIFFFGNTYDAASLLSLDGWWDKIFQMPGMMTPGNITPEFFGDFTFIGENKKIYKTSKQTGNWEREGFVVHWPADGKLILNTKRLEAGKYRITLADSSFPPEVLHHIKLEIQEDNTFRDISTSWRRKNIDIKIPETYPPIMLPWYSLAANYINKKKTEYLTLRKTFTYSMDFSTEKGIARTFLSNYGNKDLNLIGTIEIIPAIQGKPFFYLDLDWEEAESINRKAEFFLENKISPLLWKHSEPKYNFEIQTNSGNQKSVYFTLDRNCGDIKTFYPIIP